MKILGISASLRNRRFAYKNRLVEDIKNVQNFMRNEQNVKKNHKNAYFVDKMWKIFKF